MHAHGTIGRRAAGAGAAVLLAVVLAGCSGGSGASDDAAGTDEPVAAETTAAGEPGLASCELSAPAEGTVELTETDDAYDVVFTGVPVSDTSARSKYDVTLLDHAGESVRLSATWESGALTSYGLVTADGESVPQTGEPEVADDVVTVSYPKSAAELADLVPTQWSPEVYTADPDGVVATCGDGQTLPWTPLG